MTSNHDRTIADVFETLNEEQKKVVYALIGKALEDAEKELLSDKHCSNCGTPFYKDAHYCVQCGTSIDGYTAGQRRQEYAGKVIKCPSCGTEIPSFTAICPGCGHEINSSHVSASLNIFIEKLDALDRKIASAPKAAKEGWASWNGGQRFWWIVLNIFTYCIPLVIYLILPLLKFNRTPKLTSEEEQKASFIENYAFTNEREAILEALLFIESKVAFLASHQVDRKVAYWSRLWTTKAKQLYRKASMMLQGDKNAEEAYSDILDHNKRIKKIFKRRAVIGGVILIISGTLICIPRVFPQLNPLDMASQISTHIDQSWPSDGLAAMLPATKSKERLFIRNTDSVLEVEVEDMYYSDREEYIRRCKEYGFTIDMKEENLAESFTAYNADGYYLELYELDYGSAVKICLYAPDDKQQIVWDQAILSPHVPSIPSALGGIKTNTKEKLIIRVVDVTPAQFAEYCSACVESGYAIDTEETETTFCGYSNEGYYLDLEYIADLSYMIISIEAPEEMTQITWPKSSIAKLVPKPESMRGRITYDRSDYFAVYIADTTKEEYQAYVEECIDEGFNVDYEKHENAFYGDNKKGYSLTIKYTGGHVMFISIDEPYDP